MTEFLNNIFIGIVAIAAFLITTYVLGYFSIKFNIVNANKDAELIGTGCAMWVAIVILIFVVWIIGYAINAFFL
jgi:hypothetical protein